MDALFLMCLILLLFIRFLYTAPVVAETKTVEASEKPTEAEAEGTYSYLYVFFCPK